MSIYDINYNDKVVELLPPDKRGTRNVGWLRAVVSTPLQYVRNKFLGNYRLGNTYPVYLSGGTYNTGDIVQFNQRVYESNVDSNTDSPPSTNWSVYLPSFIGVDTRVYFNGQKLVLEYALNQYLFTSFRQPPLVSDVYISLAPLDIAGFLVAETTGSTVAQSDIATQTDWAIGTYNIGDLVRKDGYMYLSLTNGNTDVPPSANWHKTETVGYNSPFVRLNNFTIFIPSAVYTSSLPQEPNIEMKVREFVDRLIPAGIKYTITPY